MLMTRLWFDRIAAPKGAPFAQVLIAVDGDQLAALDFNGYETRMERLLTRHYGAYEVAQKSNPCGFSTRLRAYLHGEIDALNAIPVSTGGTEFQRAAWQALRTIPAGRTAT